MKRSNFCICICLFLSLYGLLSSIVVQIGDGTLLNQSIPIEPYSHFSYSQSLYTGTEIGSGGQITSIGLQYRINGSIFLANNSQFSIYLGAVNRDRFNALTDWVPLDSLQLVFQGDLQAEWFSTTLPGQGWLTIPLTTFFAYSGNGSLVVAVDENNPGYSSTGDDFYCSAAALPQSLIYHSNVENPDPANPPPATNINPVNPLSVRPNLQLEIQPVVYAPFAPNPTDGAIDIDLAPELTWQSDADTWDVWFAGAALPLQQVATGLTEPSWQVPLDLALLANYHWQVFAHHLDEDFPGAVWTFTTIGETLTPPLNLQASTVNMAVQLNWTPPVQGTIAGYRILRNQQLLDEIPNTNYLDTAVLPGQTYWYQVLAVNYLNQVSPPSNLVSATLPPSLPLWEMSFDDQPDFTGSLPGWILSDLDGNPTWMWEETDFPGEGTPLSWIVFNPSQADPPITGVTAHNGQKMLLCVDSTSPPNNDWLISPRLTIPADGQISFWARSYTADYGLERLRFLVSATDTLIASFQPLSNEPWLNVPAEWTQINYDLSAYAGQQVYFAWNCVSWDAFALCLDEIYLTGSTPNSDEFSPAIEKINIYPNPARDFFTISGKVAGYYDISIYNVKGQRLIFRPRVVGYTWKKGQGMNLPSGVYFALCQQDHQTFTRKFLVY